MPFIPHTKQDIKVMLGTIGVKTIEELFNEIPQILKTHDLPHLPPALNEMQLARLMRERAAKDTYSLNFIGAGAYEHHIPGAVWDITSRGEWMTAYTPYQAEASQGTLQLLYEYQTMMASLMALDVSNASLYDGASALAEAVLMAVRLQRGKKSHTILVPASLHPHYRAVIKTIVHNVNFIEIPFNRETGCLDQTILEKQLEPSALIIAQPNFFGGLEEVDQLTNWAHAKNALVIGVVNPLAMALLKPPGQWGEKGADIACGEGQPLGIPLASGGPYYGLLCCRKEFIRQLPGRIVGRTRDQQNRSGFVLTLQAREQHIRRARANSNICTNQGLLVTASVIYMSLLGPEGLRQVAAKCHAQMFALTKQLRTLPGIRLAFEGAFFHECVLQFDQSINPILETLFDQGILAGLPLEKDYPMLPNSLLVCVTETKTAEDLAAFVSALQNAMFQT